MQDVLEDFSIAPLRDAMEANVHEAWIRLGRGLGAVVHDEPELLWFLSGLPMHLANGIVRTHFPSDMEEKSFEERLKRLTTHHVPMAWLIGPSTRPTDLLRSSQRLGLSALGRVLSVLCGSASAPLSLLGLRHILEKDSLQVEESKEPRTRGA